MGRAARNVNAKVVMYADTVTGSMQRAIEETQRRRAKQLAYNEAHGITPATIKKDIRRGIEAELKARRTARRAAETDETPIDARELVRVLEAEMLEAAGAFEFEKAAALRDQMLKVREIIEAEAGPAGDESDEPVMLRRGEIERPIRA
ncbi:MAG TPA: hypothetical protein ENK11_05435, partial [Phycisphaerales bacterium]|nr:hypothetical protein [Phycisphaerales bacterium]